MPPFGEKHQCGTIRLWLDRRCWHDKSLPLRVRFVGGLLLPDGQSASRTVQLKTTQISHHHGNLQLLAAEWPRGERQIGHDIIGRSRALLSADRPQILR